MLWQNVLNIQVIVDEDKALEKIKQALREKSHATSSSIAPPSLIAANATTAVTLVLASEGNDSNSADILTGESVAPEQLKKKQRRDSLRRRSVASTATTSPSPDSNFDGIVLEQQQQQQPAEPTRFANDSWATLGQSLDEAQRHRSFEILRQQLHLSEHRGGTSLQQPMGAKFAAAMPTSTAKSALEALSLQQQQDSFIHNMLMRQREQRLQLELLQVQQHYQLSWQQQHHLEAHRRSLSLGPTLQRISDPFLSVNGNATCSTLHSSLNLSSDLLNQTAAWDSRLANATTSAANARPSNPDAALWGLIPRLPTSATSCQLSNRPPLAATNDSDEDDCKPRASKRARN